MGIFEPVLRGEPAADDVVEGGGLAAGRGRLQARGAHVGQRLEVHHGGAVSRRRRRGRGREHGELRGARAAVDVAHDAAAAARARPGGRSRRSAGRAGARQAVARGAVRELLEALGVPAAGAAQHRQDGRHQHRHRQRRRRPRLAAAILSAYIHWKTAADVQNMECQVHKQNTRRFHHGVRH